MEPGWGTCSQAVEHPNRIKVVAQGCSARVSCPRGDSRLSASSRRPCKMRRKNHDPDFDDRMMEYSDDDSEDEPAPKVRGSSSSSKSIDGVIIQQNGCWAFRSLRLLDYQQYGAMAIIRVCSCRQCSVRGLPRPTSHNSLAAYAPHMLLPGPMSAGPRQEAASGQTWDA